MLMLAERPGTSFTLASFDAADFEPASFEPACRPVKAFGGPDRFFAWQGRSGRRITVSVYAPGDCPDYEHVAAFAVRRSADGSRRILVGVDLGTFPSLVLGGSLLGDAVDEGANEIHLHLLADTPGQRSSVIADLT